MNAERPTLLVVDDEPEVLRSVRDLLRLDYNVLTAERGEEALRRLDENGAVHVVMSDQRMPGLSGVELLREVKRRRPEATRLLFTAYADVKAVIDAINQGSVFRYITKPWDPDELQTVVRQAVEHHDLLVEKERLIVELREANRRLIEANGLKRTFLEVASHELNTPVAVILGLTELHKLSLAAGVSLPDDWVDRIHAAGKRLAASNERMLKLVQNGEFRAGLSLERFNPRDVLNAVLADLALYLDVRGQHLDVAIEPEVADIEADRSKFTDIFVNLLLNAIKFTLDGGTIGVRGGTSGPDQVWFEVRDQGTGIDPRDRPYLFQPFFTGFDTMHHSSGDYQYCKRGLGLGLCLVKTFVDLHGGAVDVETALGTGSTFRFTLPRRASRVASASSTGAASVKL